MLKRPNSHENVEEKENCNPNKKKHIIYDDEDDKVIFAHVTENVIYDDDDEDDKVIFTHVTDGYDNVNDTNDNTLDHNDNNNNNQITQIIENKTFINKLDSYVENFIRDFELTLEIQKLVEPLVDSSSNIKAEFRKKVKNLIKIKVSKHPSIDSVCKVFNDINNSAKIGTDFRNKDQNGIRYENFKKMDDIIKLMNEYTFNGVLITRSNIVIYNTVKKGEELLCLKDVNDIFAVIFYGGKDYIQTFNRSIEVLIDKIYDKLSKSLNINIEEISDENMCEHLQSDTNLEVGSDSIALNVTEGEDNNEGNNSDDLDSIFSLQNSETGITLSFSEEVQQNLFELEKQINKNEDNFTDNNCPFKNSNLKKTLILEMPWTEHLSFDKFDEKETKQLNCLYDDKTKQTGKDLWENFLRDKTFKNVEIDYHCCNIFTLFSRFYDMKMEPTCIFMMIGTIYRTHILFY